jgi:hypothetical protein
MFGLWWPVVLIAVAAPFVVHGYDWLQAQRTIAVHERQLTAERKEAARLRQVAYDAGRRAGVAEVRDQERGETERTRAVIGQLETELQEALAKARETPPAPAELIEQCKRSASCRERRTLK